MSHRPWFPNLRSRLQPASRRQRRRAKGSRNFEQLETRALLTTVTDSPAFNIVNQSQFAPGDAVVSSNSYFLGAQNFDTGTQTVGGFVQPFGVNTGVQASLDLNGTAGLNLGYFVNSGSFDASYDSSLTQTFNDPRQSAPCRSTPMPR